MSTPVSLAPNRNQAFAAALFEELERAGIRHVCACPGSRSSPLAVAAAQSSLRAWSHVDERAAAFFALGLAKASRRPVALLCTSGTASANFLPAVIEAHYARVPLLVLTADRPPELREWGAGQTIDQVRLYGSHVRWYAEAPLPDPSGARLRHTRALACRAVAEAWGSPPGPVHLNLPLREPLAPSPRPGDRLIELAERDSLAAAGRGDAPYLEVSRAASPARPEEVAWLSELVSAHERGVIACGPMDVGSDLPEALAELGAAAGWPVLADPTAQLRAGAHVEHGPMISTADLLLGESRFASQHVPEVVLRVGPSPTSKALRLWVERHTPPHLVLVDADGGWNDPSHLASRILRAEPAGTCAQVARRLRAAPRRSAWCHTWLEAEKRAVVALDAALDQDEELLSPRLVRELGAALPEDALLYVSNSMPVRDLDAFLPRSDRSLRVLCNRGANGIDGMVSSALGATAAGEGPTVLLTGDLALLHDLGGLLAAHRHELPLTIVAVDNDGGGIFSYLPVARYVPRTTFEDHFRTPHRLDLAAAASGLGVAAQRIASTEHFRTALKEALTSDATSLLVVPVDRDRDVAQHRELRCAVSRALTEAAP